MPNLTYDSNVIYDSPDYTWDGDIFSPSPVVIRQMGTVFLNNIRSSDTGFLENIRSHQFVLL